MEKEFLPDTSCVSLYIDLSLEFALGFWFMAVMRFERKFSNYLLFSACWLSAE